MMVLDAILVCLWIPHRRDSVVQPFQCSTCSKLSRQKLTRPKQSNICQTPAGEFSPLMYESRPRLAPGLLSSGECSFPDQWYLSVLSSSELGGTLEFLQRHDDRYSFSRRRGCCASGCRNDEPAQNHMLIYEGCFLRNVFRSGGLYAVAGDQDLLREKCWAVCSGSLSIDSPILCTAAISVASSAEGG